MKQPVTGYQFSCIPRLLNVVRDYLSTEMCVYMDNKWPTSVGLNLNTYLVL